jgi:hypothetical protein
VRGIHYEPHHQSISVGQANSRHQQRIDITVFGLQGKLIQNN